MTNKHARRFMLAVRWIITQPRTLVEKIEALGKLSDLPKEPVVVSLPLLTGWK